MYDLACDKVFDCEADVTLRPEHPFGIMQLERYDANVHLSNLRTIVSTY